ncbi:MAG: hypothetical protein AAGA71_19845 [Pseudomonadota bacterium]
MDKNTGKPGAQKGQADRDERLKAALKANLQRRKAQARARKGSGKS